MLRMIKASPSAIYPMLAFLIQVDDIVDLLHLDNSRASTTPARPGLIFAGELCVVRPSKDGAGSERFVAKLPLRRLGLGDIMADYDNQELAKKLADVSKQPEPDLRGSPISPDRYHSIATPDCDIFMIAAGRYLDRFKRRDGVRKISHRLAVYDWNRVGPSTDCWDRDSLENPIEYGQRGHADASYAHLLGVMR